MNTQKMKSLFKDLASLQSHRRLWGYLAWSDIRQRYVGSIIGPFWITISMVLFIACISVIYSRILHQPIQTYVPFLTCGLLMWLYLSTTITESCYMFVYGREYIHSISLPYSLFLYRVICRNVLVLMHNAIVLVPVYLFLKISLSWNMLLFIPGFILVTVNLTAASLLIGILATRYRDIPPIITSVIQIMFFVSPITWDPDLLDTHTWIVDINPVTHMLALTRDPLLGKLPGVLSYEYIIVLTGVSLLLSLMVFNKKRSSIPFWL